MNILHLQNRLNISCGVSRTIYLIAKNTSSNFNHNVACFDGDGFSRFDSINIKPLVLKDYNNSNLGFIIHCLKLYSFCKHNSINIIHSHHRYFDVLAFFLSHILKIKTITSVHSKVYGKKIFSYKANKLIACGNNIKEHIVKIFAIKENRISVIFNSVDPQEIEIKSDLEKIRTEQHIPNEARIIGFAGRFDFQEKGIDILLKAFKGATTKIDGIHLILVGSGINKDEIETFIKMEKIPATIVSAQKNIFDYINIFDVFVLPSRVDPFPLIMLEIGYMKKPLIGSKVDGIVELIENEKTGLLFDSEDVEQLTACIIRVINDKNLSQNLAENLYKKVNENFLSSKMIEQYQEEYKKLLGLNVV